MFSLYVQCKKIVMTKKYEAMLKWLQAREVGKLFIYTYVLF